MPISQSQNFSSKIRHRFVEDFILVWLNCDFDESNANDQQSLNQLQDIIDLVLVFNNCNQFVQFLTDVTEEKVFLIVSKIPDSQLISSVENFSQLQAIYLLEKQNQWTCNNDKVKGIFNEMESIYEILRKEIHQMKNSMMPISIMNIPSSINLNELDQSFMYTQLLKDILLKMESDNSHKDKLVEYCRNQYKDSRSTLKIIDEFKEKYPNPSPIWWYTRESFVYWMLNRAFRTQDVELIIKMGFVARDLHQQIEQLHSQSNNSRCFTVYRGQGMFKNEFIKMKNSEGGLLSFNNFLSTSTDQLLAKAFAESAQMDPNLIGVLFQMEINSSAIFTSLGKNGYFQDSESEILFSMHTVFRIGQVKQFDNQIWEVQLTLTNDNDEQLIRLMECIRETTDASTGLHRLGSLMFVMGEYNKAEEIFEKLLETTTADEWEMFASLYHMLGYVNYEKNNQLVALDYFKKSLEIELKHLSKNDHSLCRNYSGIGLVLKEQGQLDEALEYFQRSLSIDLDSSNPKQLNIATHYNNIAGILDEQCKYTEALTYYQRALEIETKELPSYHPSLSNTYVNIADTYNSMEDYSTALSYYQEALQIQQKSLPSNHPWFSTTYNNIADVYDSLNDSTSALVYYKKALESQEQTSIHDDSSLAMIHYNIARTLEDLDRYSEAIEHATETVDIITKVFDSDNEEVKEYQAYLNKLCQNL